jgi:hypothetical protein
MLSGKIPGRRCKGVAVLEIAEGPKWHQLHDVRGEARVPGRGFAAPGSHAEAEALGVLAEVVGGLGVGLLLGLPEIGPGRRCS